MRRRRRSRKLVPDGDLDFAVTGEAFARVIARNPQRFMLTGDDAERIARAMAEFRAALLVTLAPGGCRKTDTIIKDELRAKAKAIVREYANIIRANPKISAIDKLRLRIKPRAEKPKERTCPQTAPELDFVGTDDGGAAMPIHVLRFMYQGPVKFNRGMMISRAKPPGAARIELFVELIEPDEPVPNHPGELGRPWYLRSYTRSPMSVAFPMPQRPMKVVYWARWADAKGGVGPFSKTCEGPVAGWPNAGALEDKRKGTRVVVSLRRRELPPIVERSGERPLLECEERRDDGAKALPDAA